MGSGKVCIDLDSEAQGSLESIIKKRGETVNREIGERELECMMYAYGI